MWRFLAKLLLQMFITLLLFQTITYFLMDAQPGDIADLLTLNPDIPPAEGRRLRAELGLDRPPVARFFQYLANFHRGDLGVSFQEYPKQVTDIIAERLPRTMVLFVSATLISFSAGYLTGKVLAWRRGGFIEYASTITGVTLYTVFTPWFALMMIWLFAVTLDWLPAGKFLYPEKWLTAPIAANVVFIRMIWSSIAALVALFIGMLASNKAHRRQRPLVRAGSLLIPLIGLVLYWATNGLGFYAWDIASHLILPVLTVTLIAYGGTMLLMRTSMLETLREDYILTARAKGLPDSGRQRPRTSPLPWGY